MLIRVFIALLGFAAVASAQKPTPKPAVPQEPDPTALGALKLLDKETAKRVARIEAREGHPFPTRWYVLVHDPAEPRGLREFVFSEGMLLTQRTLSQFADTLEAKDVIGADTIKLNSDEAAGVAAKFALHNSARLGTVHYELLKEGTPPLPIWRLSCLDADGAPLGTILLHAGKGTVLGFDGFAESPVVVAARPAPDAPPKTSEPSTARPKKTTSTPPPRARSIQRKPAEKPGPIDRIGNSVRKIFGRDR